MSLTPYHLVVPCVRNRSTFSYSYLCKFSVASGTTPASIHPWSHVYKICWRRMHVIEASYDSSSSEFSGSLQPHFESVGSTLTAEHPTSSSEFQLLCQLLWHSAVVPSSVLTAIKGKQQTLKGTGKHDFHIPNHKNGIEVYMYQSRTMLSYLGPLQGLI